MKLDIKKIQLSELESFVQSNTFLNFNIVPITPLRVASYINNPNAHSTDIVLYLGFSDQKLVAFRTIFAGKVNTSEPIRFGWCSGNWVHTDYRRKGFSEHLLNIALKDWDYKLMFTNYAPNSHQLYLKTGKFHVIHQFQGFRGYLFPKINFLFPKIAKNALMRIFFAFVEMIITFISLARIRLYRDKINPDVRFDMLKFPDEMCLKLTEQNQSNSFFSRGREELNWIFKYPWMTNNTKDFSAKYPFSSFANDFNYHTVKIFYKNNFTGYFMFSVRNNHLKTLLFEVSDEVEDAIAAFIKNYCIEKKIHIITIYNNTIADLLLKRKSPFLYTKRYGQNIYSSFKIEQKTPLLFQDGDGDVIFT